MSLCYSLAGIPVWTNTSSRLDTREDGIASATKGEGPPPKVEHFEAYLCLLVLYTLALQGWRLSWRRLHCQVREMSPQTSSPIPKHPNQTLMNIMTLASLTPARFPVSISGECRRLWRGAHLQAEHSPEPTVHKSLLSPAPGVSEFHSDSF